MDVEVSVDETPAQDPSPAVVVVEGESESTLPTVIDLVERMVRLEGRMDAVESRAAVADFTAQEAVADAQSAGELAVTAIEIASEAETLAEEVAEIALETADETGVLPEVFEEVDPQVIEPDVSPQKTHWLYRTREEWRSALAK